MDTYFKFGYGGDCYLGQVLSLKDANSNDFGTLPAHWKDASDPNIERGIECCFPGLLETHRRKDYNPQSLLKLFLAQLVYHSGWLKGVVNDNPGHDFGSIPLIFDSPDLLDELKKNVTLDPSPDMRVATGIPPHIAHSRQIQKTIDICGEVHGAVLKLETTIEAAINKSIDKKVKSDGHVNLTILQEALGVFRSDMIGELKEMMPAAGSGTLPQPRNVIAIDNTTVVSADHSTFVYGGKFWCVPESFSFPESSTLWMAWCKWWLGSIALVDGKQYKIKPYRRLSDKDLPTKTAKMTLKAKWRPVLSKMMQTPGLSTCPRFVPDDTMLKQSYDAAILHLRSRFSFLFVEKYDDANVRWAIGTWPKVTQPAHVMKHGTAEDKALLPVLTKRNQKHKHSRSFKVSYFRPRKTRRKDANMGS